MLILKLPVNLFATLAVALVGCASATSEPGKEPASRSSDGESKKSASVKSKSKPKLGKETWTSSDGAEFPWTSWGSNSQVKTVVVAVHGLSGAESDFRPLGEYFRTRSTAVYSYALRGQGNDPAKERVGDIKKPELWYADLDTFLRLVRAAHPKAKVFLYGESLGGLISVYGLDSFSKENRASIHGLILASPVVSLKDRKKVPRLKYALLKSAIFLLPRRTISLQKLAGDKADMKITADTDHIENVRNTPHALDEFSFRLLGTLEKLIDGYDEAASKVDKPILVLYPGHDLLTTSEDVEEWFAGLETKDKEKRLFSKSYHMLLHDDERAEVLETVRKWIDRH